MDDLGFPIAYTVLEPGARVFTCDGKEIGKVTEVIADTSIDIFDGLVISQGGLGTNHRYIAGEHVEECFEHGVLLKLDAEAAESLPEPSR